jgi:hypothetical protein
LNWLKDEGINNINKSGQVGFLAVPALRPIVLDLFFIPMWNDGFPVLQIVHLNQVLPGIEVEAENGLMSLDALCLCFTWSKWCC